MYNMKQAKHRHHYHASVSSALGLIYQKQKYGRNETVTIMCPATEGVGALSSAAICPSICLSVPCH